MRHWLKQYTVMLAVTMVAMVVVMIAIAWLYYAAATTITKPMWEAGS